MRVGCVGIRIGGLRSPARGHNGSVFRCIRKREKTEGAKKKNGPPSAAGRVRPKNRCSAHLQGAKKMSLFTAVLAAAGAARHHDRIANVLVLILPRLISMRGVLSVLGRAGALVVLLAGGVCARANADEPGGAQLYKQLCARCHGAEGEGTKKEYTKPLAGKWPLNRLTRYIAAEMPDDAPGTLKPAEAAKVSAYIFDAFYSPAAQARQKLPRAELARLTVRQYRNAVADMVASFRPAPPQPGLAGTGLKGEYFKGKVRGFNKGAPAIARVDPVLQVDLSTGS